ncbi:hypothetical protein SAMN05216388_1004255 [Halorientalis persicus]|jgi:hypothetical protein|uniref:Major facilitator superfamily (MFS) profile domain-containing protein n=1 Tax=Halorientalis persicus TaxID=1367881 RepID=A0A1H8ISY2_9EURY|nr:hypothetical protein [Halorientalis persicus]SEN71245.1 hypothetical protein SAMN05216388_1004255 [Halorientalis persicus]
MLDKIGTAGVLGLVLLLGGIGVVAIENPLIAAGICFVIAGLLLVAYGFVTTILGTLGMGMGDVT